MAGMHHYNYSTISWLGAFAPSNSVLSIFLDARSWELGANMKARLRWQRPGKSKDRKCTVGMVNFCSVATCRNSSRNRPDLSFFSFPRKENTRRFWRNFCRRSVPNSAIKLAINIIRLYNSFVLLSFSTQVGPWLFVVILWTQRTMWFNKFCRSDEDYWKPAWVNNCLIRRSQLVLTLIKYTDMSSYLA